mgnify:FL=1
MGGIRISIPTLPLMSLHLAAETIGEEVTAQLTRRLGPGGLRLRQARVGLAYDLADAGLVEAFVAPVALQDFQV